MARLKIFVAMAFLSTSTIASAVVTKTFTPTAGYMMLSINSERYRPYSESMAVYGMMLEASMNTRWLINLSTISSVDETFSGAQVGATYQFGSRSYDVGDSAVSGYGYRSKIFPKWRSQVSASIGRWRFAGKMRSSATQLVKLQSVPVKADVYGVTFGYHLYRLITEEFYFTSELNSTQALAPGFNVSAYTFLIGVAWWL